MSAVEPYRDGRIIWAPKRAEADDGTVGVGWVQLQPRDPGYAMWDRYLRRGSRGAGTGMNMSFGKRVAQRRGEGR